MISHLRYFPRDPELRHRCAPIFDFGFWLEDLATNMTIAMYEHDGVGLAAPQLGFCKQLFVYDDQEGHTGAIVNPHVNPVIGPFNSTSIAQEGCLSIPGLVLSIRRLDRVRVSGLDIFGEKISFTAEGLLARIMQHEYDHLHAKLIVDYQGED